MKWAGHVARVGIGEVHTEFRWGNLRDRNHLESLGVGERIILKCIFKKQDET